MAPKPGDPMKGRIAIPASAPDLDAPVASRFARAAFILLVAPETLAFEALDNPARDALQGAGLEEVEILSERDVGAVVAQDFGPNARVALEAAGIVVGECRPGSSVRDAVACFNEEG